MSKPNHSKQIKKACKSCPWIDDDRDKCFRPEALEETVVDWMAQGKVHHCHSDGNAFCAGYLSFAKFKKPGGFSDMAIAQFALNNGIIAEEKIKDLGTFDSIKAMLRSHRWRSKFSVKA